jgi:virulence factor
MDKHRSDSVGHDLRFTLLDDYLHVVDTALWLAGDKARLSGGALHTTAQGEMLYAEHHFSCGMMQITTSMHRRAGSQREWVQAVTDGGLYEVRDMREWQEERGRGVIQRPVPAGRPPLSSVALPAARGILSNACKIRRFLKRPASRRCWLSAW